MSAPRSEANARPAGRLAPVDTALVGDLRAALAPDRVRVGALELDLYARDAGAISGHAEVVCFPLTAEEVQAAVRVARAHGRPFVPRGSGTGLAGGAVPVGDPVVIVTTKMTRVLSIDEDERMAWVEPGVLNLDLTRAVEVLHDGALAATDDHDHLFDPRFDRLLDAVLDGGLVDQGQHLLGLRLGDRQKAGSQPGRRDDGFANRSPVH